MKLKDAEQFHNSSLPPPPPPPTHTHTPSSVLSRGGGGEETLKLWKGQKLREYWLKKKSLTVMCTCIHVLCGWWEPDWCVHVFMCGDVVVYNTCINTYCLQGDYFYGRILKLVKVLFVEIYLNFLWFLSSCLYSTVSLILEWYRTVLYKSDLWLNCFISLSQCVLLFFVCVCVSTWSYTHMHTWHPHPPQFWCY